MSQGQNKTKIDRVIELFKERKLYKVFSPRVAFLIELILKSGATPIDIIQLKEEHVNKKQQTITIKPYKQKSLPPTTHTLSGNAIRAFFSLENQKPLSSFSIRRLQQLIKQETERVGSDLTTMRALRREYLKEVLKKTKHHLIEKTQLTSLTQRSTLTTQEQKKLQKTTYNSRNKTLILTLLKTGLRVQEVLLLQQHHIQKNELIISEDISHNETRRSIPLPHILKNYTTKNTYLFSSKNKPLTQRRFEQICKEVAQELSLEELTPSLLRATAIFNLGNTLSQEELFLQTGLQTNTIYTHGFLTSSTDSTTTTTQTSIELETLRKDSENEYSDDFMYHRSKLRDGGDTDE